ncbi:MAG: DUF134 domain-containing protein [Methanomassiliicoccales archaeon]|nr:DUF134 domain-containing protein [Methanomassiliicoccales archaeon]
MQGMRCRRRHGQRGRSPKPIHIRWTPRPEVDGGLSVEPVIVELAEVEALRLVDMDGLSQEEAGDLLGVSRGTVWRLVQSGRGKLIQALVENRRILLEG